MKQKRLFFQFYNFHLLSSRQISLKWGLTYYKNVSAGLTEADYEYLLKLKVFLSEFSGLQARPCSLKFFNILGQKPLFRKKKNTNFSLTFKSQDNVAYIGESTFSQILSVITFWFDTMNYLRVRYQLNIGFFLRIFKSSVRINFINPQFISSFVSGDIHHISALSTNIVLSLDIFIPDPLLKNFFIKYL